MTKCPGAYKALLPAFVQWLNAERARGTPAENVLATMSALLTSFGFTAVLNTFSDKEAIATSDHRIGNLAIAVAMARASSGVSP